MKLPELQEDHEYVTCRRNQTGLQIRLKPGNQDRRPLAGGEAAEPPTPAEAGAAAEAPAAAPEPIRPRRSGQSA